MQNLITWKENEISRLKRDLDAIFKRRCRDFGIPLFMETQDIHLELTETDAELVLTALLPDILPDDIDISATEDSLTIRIESRFRKVTADDTFNTVTERSSTYNRRFTLPVRIRVEEIQAVFEKQNLRVVMPKSYTSTGRGIKLQIK